MPDIWLGRISRWIEKFFNVKGGPSLVDLQPSLQATIALDKGVDHRYLEGQNRFSVEANQAAVAAQNSRARIRNPGGSNMIIVLEQLCFFSGGAADSPIVTWGAVTTDLATLITLTFTRMDPRGQPQPTAIVSVNAQAAGGQAFMQRVSSTTTNIDFINNPNQEIPILPGQAVDVQCQTVNNALNVTFMWRERALESSELT